jgi:hypothetical protein
MELNFAGGFDENPYKHLQDFKEICATLMNLWNESWDSQVEDLSIFINGMGKTVV